MFPIAYLRCEMKGRDLRSRLLIGAHLLKRGYPVLIGQFWALNANLGNVPSGCALFSTSNGIQGQQIELYRTLGHAVVACDEEALSTAESLVAHTTSPKAVEHCNAYLALNSIHAGAIAKEYPAHAGKVVVAGTARADLLRSGDMCAPPNIDPYILVNTSFGLINSIWPSEQKAVEIYAAGMGWDLSTPEHRKIMDARLEYERVAFKETTKLIDEISCQRVDIVVRPHPSERFDPWKFMPGVRVVQGSDPYPWLRHAEVVIHNDSTIGIESAVMGIPTLNLSPTDEWASRVNLRRFNQWARTADEAAAAIRAGIEPRPIPEEICPLNAAEKTADIMASFLPPPAPMGSIRWNHMDRSDVQRLKFTVSPEEFIYTAQDVFNGICDICNGAYVDDSVFLLRPNS